MKDIHLKIKEVENSDWLIGQCIEYPFIIVRSLTVESLYFQARKHLEIYFRTFPEKEKEENEIL